MALEDVSDILGDLPGTWMVCTKRRAGVRRLPRAEAKAIIIANHYTRRFPSGWTRCYGYNDVVIVFSIPANKNLEKFLFGGDVGLRELARVWAPDHHAPGELTSALSTAVKLLKQDVPECKALVSFADPNMDHHGGVYQAASWVYTGQSSEARVYLLEDGTPVSRRAFHSGGKSFKPNLPETRLPGKHRYVRTLGKATLRVAVKPYVKPFGDLA